MNDLRSLLIISGKLKIIIEDSIAEVLIENNFKLAEYKIIEDYINATDINGEEIIIPDIRLVPTRYNTCLTDEEEARITRLIGNYVMMEQIKKEPQVKISMK